MFEQMDLGLFKDIAALIALTMFAGFMFTFSSIITGGI